MQGMNYNQTNGIPDFCSTCFDHTCICSVVLFPSDDTTGMLAQTIFLFFLNLSNAV
jgi:hypothetical protein